MMNTGIVMDVDVSVPCDPSTIGKCSEDHYVEKLKSGASIIVLKDSWRFVFECVEINGSDVAGFKEDLNRAVSKYHALKGRLPLEGEYVARMGHAFVQICKNGGGVGLAAMMPYPSAFSGRSASISSGYVMKEDLVDALMKDLECVEEKVRSIQSLIWGDGDAVSGSSAIDEACETISSEA